MITKKKLLTYSFLDDCGLPSWCPVYLIPGRSNVFEVSKYEVHKYDIRKIKHLTPGYSNMDHGEQNI